MLSVLASERSSNDDDASLSLLSLTSRRTDDDALVGATRGGQTVCLGVRRQEEGYSDKRERRWTEFRTGTHTDTSIFSHKNLSVSKSDRYFRSVRYFPDFPPVFFLFDVFFHERII